MKARVAVANKDGRLKPGMFVTATIRAPLGRYGQVGASGTNSLNGLLAVTAFIRRKPRKSTRAPCIRRSSRISRAIAPSAACTWSKKNAPPAAVAEAAAGARVWVEGYACPMHPDQLQPQGGVCTICGCGMQTVKWRVEKLLSIPETAVIDTGTRQIVYVETEPGVLRCPRRGHWARAREHIIRSSVEYGAGRAGGHPRLFPD